MEGRTYSSPVFEFDPTRPKWQQIAEVVRQRIATGEYPALREEGLIVTTRGMGSFVAER
jgi:GntR family transcriptional regulator